MSAKGWPTWKTWAGLFRCGHRFRLASCRGPFIPGINETRRLAIGSLNGRLVTVIYTLRSDVVRIISFRRARVDEREAYKKLHGGGT
ncbi:MAG: BrnT family toxin [Nitrospinae bacterium]|nr:BrnT family toxin [Nitrospinota bacterium]